MFPTDWALTCLIASSFEIEIHHKEAWLVRHHSSFSEIPLCDAWIPWRGGLTNLPFRPRILVRKSDLKTAATNFIEPVHKWLNELLEFFLF